MFKNATVAMVSTDLGTLKLVRPELRKAPSLIVANSLPPFSN